MFFVVLKKPKASAFLVLGFLLLLGATLWLFSWLNKPYPPPKIGVDGKSIELVQSLFLSNEIGKIQLQPTSELLLQLFNADLDYIVEIDDPTPGLVSMFLGQLVPVVVVPFFDPTQKMDLVELQNLIITDPDNILVSNSLALPDFPWSDSPVRYVSSADVIEKLIDGQGKFGIVPLQDRSASVRLLSLSGIDPRQDLDSYPLKRSLYLSRSTRSLPEKIKKRYTGHQDLTETYNVPKDAQITMLAVGDIMLDRDVKKFARQESWEQIFAEVAPYIRQADIAFANLESPVGDKGHFINMFQAPPEAMKGLSYAGFDVVSLANNHTLDYHHAGMFETMRLLDEHGIEWVGAGNDIHEARAPLIKEVNGVKVGFLAYTEMWFVHAREPISWQGTEEEPGVAPAELDLIVEDIKKLRDLVDCVVVTIHWGKEYLHTPTVEQKQLARAAVDAGADLILGHHPHVLQGIEFYKKGIIAYSLGNFVFDLNLPRTWETMMLEFTLSSAGPLDMKIIPAYIFGVQPRVLEGSHKDTLYRQLRDFSLQID